MTRRKWTKAAAWTATVVTGYMWMSASLSQQDVHTTRSTQYTVQSGDTLWEIASKTDPNDYTPAVIDWVQQHNRVGEVLKAGEVLTVPAGR